MMNFKKKYLNVLIGNLGMFLSVPALAAECKLTDSNITWGTGSLAFSCDSDVNLQQEPIYFSANNGEIVNVWADGKLKLSTNQQVAELKVEKWYPENAAYILPKGQTYQIGFTTSNTSVETAHIARFTVGQSEQQDQGRVIFNIDSDSAGIDDSALISLYEIDTEKAYTSTFGEVKNSGLLVDTGLYMLEAHYVSSGVETPISSYPNLIAVGKSEITKVMLKHESSELEPSVFELKQAKPAGYDVDNLYITVEDLDTEVKHQVALDWNGSKQVVPEEGHKYRFAADDIIVGGLQYHFNFYPAEVDFNATQQPQTIVVTAEQSVVEAYPVDFTISGLPEGVTTFIKLEKDGKIFATRQLGNSGSNSLHVDLPLGEYNIQATTIMHDGMQYSAKSQRFTVKPCHDCVKINFVFTGTQSTSVVKGWPSYIAMGAVTDANFTNPNQLLNRQVDSIFKYAGDGGNGDRGKLVYPIYTQNTYKLANELTALNGHTVRPVMVVYTAEMSGGTNFEDLEDKANLTMHFVNLILLSQTMQVEAQRYDLPGSIIINPDLLGMVQQQTLLPQLQTKSIAVEEALADALWFTQTAHNWQISLMNGSTLSLMNKTPVQIIQMAEEGELKESGIYSPWDLKTGWEKAAENILSRAKVTSTGSQPKFNDDFKGWIQATNWIIKNYAPSISFGWQQNVWNTGTATWVHNGYTQAEINTNITKPTLTLWDELELYSGQYRPDFLVFDKYERNPIPGEAGSGYIWNHKDWESFLTYVEQMSKGLNNIPVMLWQMPGGHLQTIDEMAMASAATAPDYFLGNHDLHADFSNIQPYIQNIMLSNDTYHCSPHCSLVDYLLKNADGSINNWQQSHMHKAAESNVFAILWGGGSTTSVGTVGLDDHGWLAKQVNEYQKNPHAL